MKRTSRSWKFFPADQGGQGEAATSSFDRPPVGEEEVKGDLGHRVLEFFTKQDRSRAARHTWRILQLVGFLTLCADGL